MTYCVGLRLNRGFVLMSDTRTNAGVDNISVFCKMHSWEVPGERVLTVMTAGNLATTQAVISVLDERSKAPEERNPSILEAPSMFRVATLIGEALKDVVQSHGSDNQVADAGFGATLILAGQIAGSDPRMFLIYPEGNFIEASDDTPFFQIGETKYGRPILVRAYDAEMGFEDAVKLLLVSLDSTVKANLSVGLPVDLLAYERDSLAVKHRVRIGQEDAYFRTISTGWGEALREAFDKLPRFEFPDE